MKLKELFLLAKITFYKLLHCMFLTVWICKQIGEELVGMRLLKLEIDVYLLPSFLRHFAYSFTISRYCFCSIGWVVLISKAFLKLGHRKENDHVANFLPININIASSSSIVSWAGNCRLLFLCWKHGSKPSVNLLATLIKALPPHSLLSHCSSYS